MTDHPDPELPSPANDGAPDGAFFRAALEGYAEAYVRDGRLDVGDLTDAEIFDAVAQLLRRDLEETGTDTDDGLFVLSFEESLLGEARRFDTEGKHEFAVMMYATWFEHWLNAMLMWGLERRGLGKAEIRETIRTAGIPAKSGHLWHLVFGEQLEPSIVETIQAVASRRNEFVHYKWTDAVAFTSRRGDHAAAAETAVTRCLETEDRVVYGGSREAVTSAIRRRFAEHHQPE